MEKFAEQYLELVEITSSDFKIVNFDGWVLTLHATNSDDPDSWDAKINFEGVSYIECPTDFSHPRFRSSTIVERNFVARKMPIEGDEHVAAFTAETMAGMDLKTFFIVCRGISVIKHDV